ncbi:MAG TPA: TIGR01244 family sulfur transferase [Caulobacteraceae bacterium]
MPDVRDVSATFAVAPQIAPGDLPELAARFTLIINNRPDGEAPDQPSNAEMAEAARAAGVRYQFIPMVGAPGPEQVRATRAALADAAGPALAFCRSGTRSILAWALSEAAAGRPAHEVEAQALQAGYQIGPPLRALLPGLSA